MNVYVHAFENEVQLPIQCPSSFLPFHIYEGQQPPLDSLMFPEIVIHSTFSQSDICLGSTNCEWECASKYTAENAFGGKVIHEQGGGTHIMGTSALQV